MGVCSEQCGAFFVTMVTWPQNNKSSVRMKISTKIVITAIIRPES